MKKVRVKEKKKRKWLINDLDKYKIIFLFIK
jgi:hypothetical protein